MLADPGRLHPDLLGLADVGDDSLGTQVGNESSELHRLTPVNGLGRQWFRPLARLAGRMSKRLSPTICYSVCGLRDATLTAVAVHFIEPVHPGGPFSHAKFVIPFAPALWAFSLIFATTSF